MQTEKQLKIVQLTIPAMHTYMIKEDDYSSSDEVKISLISGEAEFLGMEFKRYYPLKFKMPCIILIFTWEGCEIKVEWPQDKGGKSIEEWCDISINNHLSQSPMIKYLTLHYQLTIARKLALQEARRGPRLAIVGGQNSGTNYASRLMLNYAGKLNMRPIFIDIDLDNSIFLDGTVGAVSYQYRVTTSDDLFQKSEKISYVYGNRKIKKLSYLNIVRHLAKYTNKRLAQELQNYKWKGTTQEMTNFASGIILQCPKVSEDNKNLKEIIAELLDIFEITHVLIIDSSQISSFLSRSCHTILRHNVTKIQGMQALLKLPKKNKLARYFGNDTIDFVTVKINQITLFELIEEESKNAYVRQVNIRTQLVNKTAISILFAERKKQWDPEEIARQITDNPVYAACKISKILQDEVTIEIPLIENFWQQCKNKIWVSMIAQKINSRKITLY